MAGKMNDLHQGVKAMFSSDAEAPKEEKKTDGVKQKKRLGRPRRPTGLIKRKPMATGLTKDDERTTLVLNKNQYAIIREIASLERVTIKEVVSQIFAKAIKDYERKHGKVEITDDSWTNDIF